MELCTTLYYSSGIQSEFLRKAYTWLGQSQHGSYSTGYVAMNDRSTLDRVYKATNSLCSNVIMVILFSRATPAVQDWSCQPQIQHLTKAQLENCGETFYNLVV